VNKWTKIFLVVVFFATSVFGFLIKLPSAFRHYDKELHTAFYFFAAAFLNLLFANRKIGLHLLIFGLLYFFGMGIEYVQAWSNKLFHVRIHGRYDPEDIHSNLRGLVACSLIWILIVSVLFIYDKATAGKTENNEQE
jgi:hypothetical protein